MTEHKNTTGVFHKPAPARRFLPKDEIPAPEFLQPEEVQMINEALCDVGEYGEVRLIVEKGRLRYLVTQKSLDVLKWQPGTLVKDLGI